jgi:hypothetical protein
VQSLWTRKEDQEISQRFDDDCNGDMQKKVRPIKGHYEGSVALLVPGYPFAQILM